MKETNILKNNGNFNMDQETKETVFNMQLVLNNCIDRIEKIEKRLNM